MIDPDGGGPLTTRPPGYGIAAQGRTPVGGSLRDLKAIFTAYWNGTQPPAPVGPVALPPSGTINTHINPKEKTIVLFVTDGDDTCASGSSTGNGDQDALYAASKAQALYQPVTNPNNGVDPVTGELINGADPASSVTTYMVGFGQGLSAQRLQWIAWGGSGMQMVTPTQALGGTIWPQPSAADRAQCKTCIDAFIAPSPDELATMLRAIFEQGAQTGEFTAQQSVTGFPYEYVDVADNTLRANKGGVAGGRYKGLTPTRFASTFTLPGFRGQLKAVQNVSGTAVTKWEAGTLLKTAVANGMAVCPTAGNSPAQPGDCLFSQLHGNASDTNITTSPAAIKRRIYSTARNGYYGATVNDLVNGLNPSGARIVLWPPDSTIAPNSDTQEGSLDRVMGLPPNSYTNPAQAFIELQRDFNACLGAPLPPACNSATPATKMQRARREAREMILAFMAGAQYKQDNANNPVRVSAAGVTQGQILYNARGWVLADSTQAPPAVVGPPLKDEPTTTTYIPEYTAFKDGGAGVGTLRQGFGLRIEQLDGAPVMTVVYAPANDMLHAFRAGPNRAPSTACNPATDECGGQELWGFVPYDRLGPYCQLEASPAVWCALNTATPPQVIYNNGTMGSRVINDPPRRTPHDYMLATGVRAFDVFVRGSAFGLQGVWRRVILFGRGAGGKHMTALDVTAPGTFQDRALLTAAPIPLWSRGNPDTDGTVANGQNGSIDDYNAYLKMGQTWSLPAVGYVDRTVNGTDRRPAGTGALDGVEFVGYMGSGYGQAGEGTTFYAFDVLSGDIVGSVDVNDTAVNGGVSPRASMPYLNALVADAAGYSASRYLAPAGVAPDQPHPAETKMSRVYIADAHGRLWKFLTDVPDKAIPMADLGADQPVGVGAGLIGFAAAGSTDNKPHVFINSGNDSRAGGPFRAFGFRDDGADGFIRPTYSTTTEGSAPDVVDVYEDTVVVKDAASIPPDKPFIRTFDQGPKLNPTAPGPDPVFRGTNQPATALTNGVDEADGKPHAVAFLAGTRFNPVLTAFAPSVPPYPCRSSFDTIVYALEGTTGAAAYDLNASGDDAYAIFRDSRTVAIQMTQDPTSEGGARLERDEGLITGAPDPPAEPGVAKQGTGDVVIVKGSGPLPTIRQGSTVCQ